MSAKPSLEAYAASEVSGKHDRDPPKDPKGVIKFRNNGGCPIFLSSIEIFCNEIVWSVF
jgi:hypothetical protein